MSQRRMFSLKVIDTDAFLDMPLSTQALYFHLAMRADDDGFVANPKKIVRSINAQDDDFKVLILKRFVLPFESGVCVIKHWLIHNLIRGDRYSPTQWVKEMKKLTIDGETRKYCMDTKETTKWQPNGNQMAPQVRLGKVRLGKNKEYIADKSATNDFKEIIEYYHTLVLNSEGIKPEIRAKDCGMVKSLLQRYSKDDMKKIIYSYLSSDKAKKLGIDLSIALSAHSINQWKLQK